MLQSVFQLAPPKSKTAGEDEVLLKNYYTSTIKLDMSKDQTKISPIKGKFNLDSELNLYSNGSCGTVDISTVDGFTFQGVEGVKTNCGFYQRYPYQTSVLNSASEGVIFK